MKYLKRYNDPIFTIDKKNSKFQLSSDGVLVAEAGFSLELPDEFFILFI